MRLVSWNVNGIRAVLKKDFLGSVAALDPDVLCLQETRVDQANIPKEVRPLPGYDAAWNPADRKGYSGVATFSRVPVVDSTAGFGKPAYSLEGRTLVSDLGFATLISGYFPNGGQGPERLAYKLDYYADLMAYICRLRGQGRSVIVTGDLNTSHMERDLARPRANQKKSGFMDIERAWLDRFVDAGLVDTFRLFEPGAGHYSWWSQRGGARERDVGWRLDYFFVSEDLVPRVTAATIRKDVLGSDHCPVVLDLDV